MLLHDVSISCIYKYIYDYICISRILTCTPKIGELNVLTYKIRWTFEYLQVHCFFRLDWQQTHTTTHEARDAFSDNGCKHLQAGMHQKQKFTNQLKFVIWMNIVVVHFNWIEPSSLVHSFVHTLRLLTFDWKKQHPKISKSWNHINQAIQQWSPPKQSIQIRKFLDSKMELF